MPANSTVASLHAVGVPTRCQPHLHLALFVLFFIYFSKYLCIYTAHRKIEVLFCDIRKMVIRSHFKAKTETETKKKKIAIHMFLFQLVPERSECSFGATEF